MVFLWYSDIRLSFLELVLCLVKAIRQCDRTHVSKFTLWLHGLFSIVTLGSIPGQDLSATLNELVNIQSRSLEMMAASQRSHQEAFQELTRASRDKANNSMFTAIKIFDGTNRQDLKDGINEVNQACRASNRGFRTELFKKSAGAVRQVILSCEELSDD